MTTWSEYKKTMTSFTSEELSVMDMLSALQAERIRRGISQREFADKIGMKQPQLAKIERMDSMPTLGTLSRYAAGLGLQLKLLATV
jgi:transcriptional regulator with XRE-family HTH domain